MLWEDLEWNFDRLLAREKREGLISSVPLEEVRFNPPQAEYLEARLQKAGFSGSRVTAVSLALALDRREVESIPRDHRGTSGDAPAYARAYGRLNGALDRVASRLASELGGLVEGATLEGRAGRLDHVSDYYPHCFSHRQVAQEARLGWRGHHGLLVTPEFGPAVRLATVLMPDGPRAPRRQLGECGSCRACAEICGALRVRTREGDSDRYREKCRQTIKTLDLGADVCGVCVRVCWERVVLARS